MVSEAEYFKGRDEEFACPMSVRTNAELLLRAANLLLEEAGRSGVKHEGVSSGWRPAQINRGVKNAAAGSAHISGEALDLADNGNRDLARWCLQNRGALERYGLYMERPQWTPTWVHLQIRPAKRRYFIPSTSKPLCKPLPGEVDA